MAMPSVLGEPVMLPLLLLLGVMHVPNSFFPPLALWEAVIYDLLTIWGSQDRWLLPHTPYPSRLHSHVSSKYHSLPSVKLDFHPSATHANRYSHNKAALYIETRATVRHVTPLLTHMMEVVPPEWRFVFVGTDETVRAANTSAAARRYQDWGKLRLARVDRWAESGRWGRQWEQDISIDELTSRLLTDKAFYGAELPGVEWLFVFHSDAILCANSAVDLNDWLGFDWVGAPWNNIARFGGNGALSLRRVSKVLEVLDFQERIDPSLSEDSWLSSRLGLLPGANMASPEIEKQFAVDDLWAERPMGYHINPAGWSAEVWNSFERRKMIYEYCPEIKIIMDMRLERERCPDGLSQADWSEQRSVAEGEANQEIGEEGAEERNEGGSGEAAAD